MTRDEEEEEGIVVAFSDEGSEPTIWYMYGHRSYDEFMELFQNIINYGFHEGRKITPEAVKLGYVGEVTKRDDAHSGGFRIVSQPREGFVPFTYYIPVKEGEHEQAAS